MARVDSLLSILVQQGANELRLGTGKEPKMLAFGTAKRLSIPVTPEDMLRELLGEVLTAEREQAMKSMGRAECSYEAAGLGGFHVKLTARTGGFDVVFLRESRKAVSPVAPTPAVAFAPSSTLASAGGGQTSPYAASSPSPATVVEAPAPEAALFAHPPAEEPSPMLQRLVASAFAMRASDLHLTQGRVPLVRIDGSLRLLGDEPLDLASVVSPSLTRGFSGDAAIEVPGSGRARLHVFHTSDGLAASVRLLPSSAPGLSSLHLPVPLDDLV
ncbi:MAG TPA: hypothetical protein VIF09_04545, partial [Polyangiaceae bacterium]